MKHALLLQEDQIASFDEQAKTYQVAYEQRLREVPSNIDLGEDSVSENTALSTIPDTSAVDRCGELCQSDDFLDDILRASDANNFVDSSRDVETQQLSEDDVNSVIDSATLSGFTRTLENDGNIASSDCENISNVKLVETTENTSSAAVSTEPALPHKLTAATETVSQKHSPERKTVNHDEPQKMVASIEDELDFLLTLEVPVSKEVKSSENSEYQQYRIFCMDVCCVIFINYLFHVVVNHLDEPPLFMSIFLDRVCLCG